MSTKRALINTAATAREAPHPLRRLQSEIGRGALPGARVCGRGAGDVRGSQTQGRAGVASRPRRWVGVERGRRREPPGPPEPGPQSPGGRAASARSRGGGEGENWGIWDAAVGSGGTEWFCRSKILAAALLRARRGEREDLGILAAAPEA